LHWLVWGHRGEGAGRWGVRGQGVVQRTSHNIEHINNNKAKAYVHGAQSGKSNLKAIRFESTHLIASHPYSSTPCSHFPTVPIYSVQHAPCFHLLSAPGPGLLLMVMKI